MKPERWNKIESIFHKALDADEGHRGAVLEESCAGDEDLRREVESLIAQHENAGDFIETPAFDAKSNLMPTRPGPLALQSRSNLAGSLFGQYRIAEEIGVGGMGVVYKAEDTKLGRPVALKFLPQHSAADHVAVERFRREARAASALNHPNICTIYDIVEEPGRVFIAMEYLEGRTLAGYISGRALATDRITKFGMAIAEALAAAHAKGVIHRDIKPGNIFVTQSDLVKVLDFGVAKLLRGAEGPTATNLTKTEGVTGTLPYMSPEQLRGQDVDARSDIYSLGVVLYEMSTGRRPYPSNLQSALIDAILNRPAPPPKNINPQLPLKLEEIILKCLEKDPEDRYQAAKEIAVDLRRMSAPSGTTTPAVASKTKRKSLVWLLAATGAIGLSLAAWWFWPLPPPEVSGYVAVTNDGNQKQLIGTDGARLYFNDFTRTGWIVSQVSASGGDVAPISGPLPTMSLLSVSPDGATLLTYTWVAAQIQGPLWEVPVLGGSASRLGEAAGQAAAWSPDGQTLAYANGKDLFLARRDGSEARKFGSFPGLVLYPSWSPDGTEIRLTTEGQAGSQLGSLWRVPLSGADPQPLLPAWHSPPNECCGQWTPDGKYFVFQSGTNIWARSERRNWFGRSDSQPVQLPLGPMSSSYPVPGKDGRKIFAVGTLARGELDRYDANSKQFLPFLSGISANGVSFSKDGQWVVYASYPGGTLWRSKVDGSQRIQLTFAPLSAGLPSWSPDGRQIVFFAGVPGQKFKVYTLAADGGTPLDVVPGDSQDEIDPTWSPDGTRIAFGGDGSPNAVIRVLDVKTHQVSTLPGSTGLYSPRWSPDGRHLVAMPSGSTSLMLFDFATQKWEEISKIGAGSPNWSKSGDYVYFFDMSQPRVVRIRIRDLKVEQVADFKNFSIIGGLCLAPGDSPLLLHNTGTQEIYALDWKAP